MTRMNTTEANATIDLPPDFAADMTGDVAPLDLTMVARGADWTEPPPRLRYHAQPFPSDPMQVALQTAERVLLVMVGWVLGLLTALAAVS